MAFPTHTSALRHAFAVVCAFLTVLGNAFAQVPVEFPGAKSFTPEDLRKPLSEQLAEINERGLSPTRADDAAFYLAAYYRGQGFSRVEVDYETRGKTLVLRVNEGPRTIIRSIRFVGNRAYPEATLFPYVIGTVPSQLAEAKLPFSDKDLGGGADRLRGFYASEGYLDVVVETTDTKVSPSGDAADLVYTIREGTRYVFGPISFTPGTGFTDAQLREALGAKPEGAFTGYAVDAMQRSLQSWLRGKGYFAVAVRGVWDKAKARKGSVAVNFEIRTGPQFRIDEVKVRGTDRIRPEFMQNRFESLKGQIYNPEKLDEKYRELQRTGLFRRLRVIPTPSAAGELDIEVEVEEAKQKEIGLELGFSTYDGVIGGIRLADRNLLGWGRPLSLRLEYAQRGFRGELLYIDPWFLESDWSLRARLYSEIREEQGYKKDGTGMRFDFARKLAPRWEVSGFTEVAVAKLSSTGIEPQFLGPPDYFLSAIGLTSTLDYRDDPLNPRHGWILGNSLEFNAIDGQYSFTRITGRYSYYRSIGRSLLAVGLRAGWIIPQGEPTDVPIDLRYFNGGGTTVRSFAERELGPRDRHGQPIGGTFYTVGNIEWDFPLAGALDGAVFADVGNLVNEDSASFEDLRYAIGVGLRYRLPIGPLRIDYGYNPDAREGEDAGALHLSFGFAF